MRRNGLVVVEANLFLAEAHRQIAQVASINGRVFYLLCLVHLNCIGPVIVNSSSDLTAASIRCAPRVLRASA